MQLGINDYLAGIKRGWSTTSHTSQRFRGIENHNYEIKQHSLEGYQNTIPKVQNHLVQVKKTQK